MLLPSRASIAWLAFGMTKREHNRRCCAKQEMPDRTEGLLDYQLLPTDLDTKWDVPCDGITDLLKGRWAGGIQFNLLLCFLCQDLSSKWWASQKSDWWGQNSSLHWIYWKAWPVVQPGVAWCTLGVWSKVQLLWLCYSSWHMLQPCCYLAGPAMPLSLHGLPMGWHKGDMTEDAVGMLDKQ